MVSRQQSPTRGEIWWVDFSPSRGSEQAGKRPALIVSDTGFNRLQHRILVVVPLTTTVRDYEFHVAAEPEHTGLRKPGMIMCDQILTIAAERLLNAEPAGRVSDELMAVVEDRIAILLGLPSPEPQLA